MAKVQGSSRALKSCKHIRYLDMAARSIERQRGVERRPDDQKSRKCMFTSCVGFREDTMLSMGRMGIAMPNSPFLASTQCHVSPRPGNRCRQQPQKVALEGLGLDGSSSLELQCEACGSTCFHACHKTKKNTDTKRRVHEVSLCLSVLR